jgi:hypothetical protein
MSILWLPHCEQTSRLRNSRTGDIGAVSTRELAGIRLDLIAATQTPHDQSDARGARAPKRHRRAGRYFTVARRRFLGGDA